MLAPAPPAADQSAIRARVQDQYTRYPYPPPTRGNSLFSPFGALDLVRWVLWPGRPSLAGLRVLDAGCGTGDVSLQIAREHPEVEVLGIDLSTASLDHARRRARELNIGDNLQLRQLPIEEAGALGGPFDYIVASGVIHHLADPDAGLRVLAGLLAPDGGMSMLLYATHGRQPVYIMQDLLRRLGGAQALDAQVKLTREVLAALPRGHCFDASTWVDLHFEGDAGLVDLLLHRQDRSYTVPEVQGLLAQAELRVERFLQPKAYLPRSYVQDTALRERLDALPADEQAPLAELLHGEMRRHDFFATRASYQPLHVGPRGQLALAMRPRRSPLFGWDRVERKRRKGVDHFFLPEIPHGPLAPRTVELVAWQLAVLAECDGERRGLDLLAQPGVAAGLPGKDDGQRLGAFGALLEALGEAEVLLFEP